MCKCIYLYDFIRFDIRLYMDGGEMKLIFPITSVRRHHKGIACMSDDITVIREFSDAMEALQRVSQHARQVKRGQRKKWKIGD